MDVDYGAVCLTLEFMNGGSLKHLMDDGKIFDLDEACVLSYCALQALSTMHKNQIVHRDVKPSNFLVNTEGVIQLSDFGISRVRSHTPTSYNPCSYTFNILQRIHLCQYTLR